MKEKMKRILGSLSNIGRNILIASESTAWRVTDYITLAVIFVFASILLGVFVFNVVAGGGLPVIIAELMANACMATGVCDYQTLLGVFGFAAVVSTSYAIFFVTIIRNLESGSGVGNIVDDDNDGSRRDMTIYNDYQREVLESIIRLGRLESLSAFCQSVNVSYSTLYDWIMEFERDGWITIKSNGSGSPMRIEVL